MEKITSVCVFCGSADKVDAAFKDAATGLGAALAKAGIRLVYGGEKAGLLGLLSSACLEAGGAVTGIIPVVLKEKGLANEAVDDLVTVRDFHERKSLMNGRAEAFIVLAGGLGTLDEAVDAVATKYGGTHNKPVVFINTAGYYAPLIATIDHMIATGFSPAWHRELYKLVDTPEAAVAALAYNSGN